MRRKREEVILLLEGILADEADHGMVDACFETAAEDMMMMRHLVTKFMM